MKMYYLDRHVYIIKIIIINYAWTSIKYASLKGNLSC